VLSNLLHYLADPASPAKLATVWRVWQRAAREDPEAWEHVQELARQLRKCQEVEQFVWPRAGRDWLAEQALAEEDEALLLRFRELLRRWLGTTLLPVDQIVLTVAQDLFDQPADLAIATSWPSC